MRPAWTGMIGFGLVNIPIKVYPATEDKEISFHFLHKDDGGRIAYQKVCKDCGQIIPQDKLVRGYEYEKGRNVMLTDEDFEKINLESAKNITIMDFVDPAEVDPGFFEKPYYLSPDPGGEMPYVLLREALRRTNKVGIAKLVFRTKEQLAMVRPADSALVLDTLRFADEVRKAEGFPLPKEDVKAGKRELEMADMLINHMTAKFEPQKYHDTYREALTELIEAKLEGEEITAPVRERKATNVIDIMEKLKASIESAGAKGKPERRRKTA